MADYDKFISNVTDWTLGDPSIGGVSGRRIAIVSYKPAQEFSGALKDMLAGKGAYPECVTVNEN